MTDPTVVIATSPIPSHPETQLLEDVVASIRAQLPDAAIGIYADGLRPEQADRAPVYYEYLRRVDALTERWGNCELTVFPEWHHQANSLRFALQDVTTETVLIVEHDCVFTGDPIPWGDLDWFLTEERAGNVVRFAGLDPWPREWRSMHLHREVFDAPSGLLPMVLTYQFSGWNHLARTDWYRRTINRFFDITSRTLTEPVLYSVLVNHRFSPTFKEDWGVWLYFPEETGSVQRIEHRDGRQTDPMYPVNRVYPGGKTPPGAPAPGWGEP